jgi:hypothetical protein
MTTQTTSFPRSLLSVGEFLFVPEDGVFVLVIGKDDPASARVMYNTGRVVTLNDLDTRVHVAVEVPVEDFGANLLARYVVEQEAEAQAARDRAENLRLTIEAVRQIQGGQPEAAATFAEAIARR